MRAALLWTAAVVGACSGGDGPVGGGRGGEAVPPPSTSNCSIPERDIFDGGVGRGGIPALTDPKLVDAGSPEADYLLDSDRVIGLRLGQQWVAVPHNILWWHEVANFTTTVGGRRAVTYCPLTGSPLVFDIQRSGVSRFIVSGLLFNNNLMMLDPDTESIWPQMSLGARCGPRNGASLAALPSFEMTWRAWRELHPDTKVISGLTGFSRDYTLYPYGRYEDLEAPPLFPVRNLDSRRFTKERVLGIPAGEGGIAFPFLALMEQGQVAVAEAALPGSSTEVVVLWDGEAEAAAAFDRVLDGRKLGFEARDGGFVDTETGSAWRIDGLAVEGPLAGSRLDAIAEAHVAFWFAWALFHPGTEIWAPDR